MEISPEETECESRQGAVRNALTTSSNLNAYQSHVELTVCTRQSSYDHNAN